MNNTALLSIREAAKYVGVNPETLRRWEKAGKITPVRTVGGKRRYSVEELEAVLGRTVSRSKYHVVSRETSAATTPVIPSGAEQQRGGIEGSRGCSETRSGSLDDARDDTSPQDDKTYVLPNTTAASIITKIHQIISFIRHSLCAKLGLIGVGVAILVVLSGNVIPGTSGARKDVIPASEARPESIQEDAGQASMTGWFRLWTDSGLILDKPGQVWPGMTTLSPTNLLAALASTTLILLGLTFIFGPIVYLLRKKYIPRYISRYIHVIPASEARPESYQKDSRQAGMTKFHSPLNAVIAILIISTLLVAFAKQFQQEQRPARAATGIARILTYQGRLLDSSGEPRANETVSMTFRIYTTSTGGTAVWTETHDGTSGNPAKITTSNDKGMEGEFTVNLGDTSNNGTAINLDFNQDTYYLGITVESNSEMSPRLRIAAAPYAFNVDTVDGINAATTPTANYLLPLTLTDAKFTTAALYASNAGNTSLDYANNTYVLNFDKSGNITAVADLRISSGNTGNLILKSASGNIVLGDGTTNIELTDAATDLTFIAKGNINFFNEATNIDSTGNLRLAGNLTLSQLTISENIDSSFTPQADASYNLGSSSLRWDRLWVNSINTTSLNTTDQSIFTYDPSDTTIGRATVFINPTTADANELLLSIAVGDSARFTVDQEGDVSANGTVRIGAFNDATVPLDVSGSANFGSLNLAGMLNFNSTLTGLSNTGTFDIPGSVNAGNYISITGSLNHTPILSLASSNQETWSLNGGDGLGWDSNISRIETITAFDGKLYVGFLDDATEADVWESDGVTWTQIGGDNIRNSWSGNSHAYVLDLTTFQGQLVTGIGSTNAGDGEAWSYDPISQNWTQIGGDGLNSSWADSTYERVQSLATLDGYLYAGLAHSTGDAELWEYDPANTTWIKVGGDGINSSWGDGSTYERVYSLYPFKDRLYAGLASGTGDAEVWEWKDRSWTKIGGDGINADWGSGHDAVKAMGEYDGRLVVGLNDGAPPIDAEAWEWMEESSNWRRLGGDGVNGSWAASTYDGVESATVYNGKLYIGLGAGTGDAEVWEWDGFDWRMVGGDGLNGSWADSTYEIVRSLEVYDGKLYVGLASGEGDAELWMWSTNTSVLAQEGDSNVSLANILYLDGRGYVGIGTRSPQRALDINGDLRIGGSTLTTARGYVGIGVTSPNAPLHVSGNASTAALFLSGNVGIGVPAPSANLDVLGNVIFRNSLRVGTTAIPTVPLDVAGSMNVGGALNIVGNLNPGGDLAYTLGTQSLRFNDTYSGNLYLSGNLFKFTGRSPSINIAYGETLVISSNDENVMRLNAQRVTTTRPVWIDPGADNFTMKGLSLDSNLLLTNPNYSEIRSDGPLTIQAGNPNTNSHLTLTASKNGVVIFASQTETNDISLNLSGLNPEIWTATPSNNLTINPAGNLYMQLATTNIDLSGNLGIGISEPAANLHVLGTTIVSSNLVIGRADKGYQPLDVAGSINLSGSVNFDLLTSITTSSPYDLLIPSANLTIDGHVGIGQPSTRANALEVAGSINASNSISITGSLNTTPILSLASSNQETWSLNGGDGLGWADSTYEYVFSQAVFDGKLYVGLANSPGDAEVWESDGVTWTQIGGDSLRSGWSGFQYLHSLNPFQGQLIAGMGSASAGDAETWAYDPISQNWTQIGGDGMNSSWADATYEFVMSQGVFDGYLYVGLGDTAGDGELWEYNPNTNTWQMVGGDGTGWADSTYERVTYIYGGRDRLYVGLGRSTGDAEVWEWKDRSWTKIGGDNINAGWGTTYEYVQSLTSYQGRLVAGLGNSAGDAEVWEWMAESSNWRKLGGDGVNGGWGSGYEYAWGLAVYNGKLYVGVSGQTAGEAELWEWDGSDWRMVGGDGLNGSWANSAYEWIPSLSVYDGKLYVGLGYNNAGDAELWMWSTNTSVLAQEGDSNVSLANVLYVDGRGYVGINNRSPQAALDINGDIRVGGSTLTTRRGFVGIGVTSPNAPLHVSGNASTAALFLSGNVGIADPSPGANLSVLGTAYMDTRLRVGDTNTATVPLDIAGSANLGSLNITGTLYYGATATGLTNQGVFDIPGSVNAGNQISITGSLNHTPILALASSNQETWSKNGGDGLGWADSTYEYVHTQTTFDGNLYVGLGLSAGDGELWESDGVTWTQIGGDSIRGSWSGHAFVLDLIPFQGQLIAGTGHLNAGDGEVWSYDPVSQNWTQIGGDGLNSGWADSTYENAQTLAVFDGYLYAGLGRSTGDAEVWEYNPATRTWKLIGGGGTGWADATYEYVYAMHAFKDRLYVGLGLSTGDAEVWEWKDRSWTKIGGDNINAGWTGYLSITSILHYDGRIVAGTYGSGGDGEVWEWMEESSNWRKIGGDGVNGSWATSTYESVTSLMTYNGMLYAGLGDGTGDAELWEWDGYDWRMVGGDGLNGSWADATYERVFSLEVYDGKLYAGLAYSAGDAELWMWSTNTSVLAQEGDSNVSLANILYLDGRGYVGIGTRSPQAALDINGDIRVSGATLTTARGYVGIGVTSPNAPLHVSGNASTAALFLSGNVGIADPSPGANLSVLGTAYITDSLRIGDTNTPTLPFDVEGAANFSGAVNILGELRVQLGAPGGASNAVCWDKAVGTATLVDCTTTPADYAEWYANSDNAEPGDIVVIAPSVIPGTSGARTPESENEDSRQAGMTEKQAGMTSIPTVEKATTNTSPAIIGVVSTDPFEVIGREILCHPEPAEGSRENADTPTGSFDAALAGSAQDDTGRCAQNPVPVALAGRVPVKVSLENGPIRAGDLLTASSTPGVAMKATEPGWIVGKALEDLVIPSDSSVIPTNNVISTDSPVIPTDSPVIPTDSPVIPTEVEGSPGDLSTDARDDTLPQDDNINTITVFLNVTWADPRTYESRIADLNRRIEELERTMGRPSAATTEPEAASARNRGRILVSPGTPPRWSADVAEAPGAATPESYQDRFQTSWNDNADNYLPPVDLIVNTLTITGMASLAETYIDGRLKVGENSLVFDQDTITAMDGVLYLQRSGCVIPTDPPVIPTEVEGSHGISRQARDDTLPQDDSCGIDLLAGAVTIDAQGNVRSLGRVTASRYAGSAASRGKVTIPAGETSVRVILASDPSVIPGTSGARTPESYQADSGQAGVTGRQAGMTGVAGMTKPKAILTTPTAPVNVAVQDIDATGFTIVIEPSVDAVIPASAARPESYQRDSRQARMTEKQAGMTSGAGMTDDIDIYWKAVW